MGDLWRRFVDDLFGRLGGPFHFRIVLQPLMAITFAVIDGVRDARAGKPAYLWAVIRDTGQRRELLKDCWKSVGKVFILAVVLDLVYQLVVIHWFYPVETLVVAFVLAIVPYVLLRGPVNRFARLGTRKAK